MKLRLEKGTYRYRTAYKKRQLFFVVLFILAIVAQLILRNFVTEQIYKNLVTISAILTVLPMANLASPLVVASRIPEVPEELHKACLPYEDKFPILYDLVITSNDLIMPVDAAVVHPTGVYLYCTNPKVDRKKAEKNRAAVEKYAFWGLAILVAIPLPGTGAWTGALVAAMMEMRLKRAFPAIAIGVVIAGVIVSIVTYGAQAIFSF